MTGVSTPGNGVNVIRSTDPGFLDACFSGLPTGEAKAQVDKVLLNKEAGEEIVNKILSGEYVFSSTGIKDRYVDKNSGYYVYTFVLDKAGVKQDIDVIFYATTNTKVMIRIDSGFYEVMISTHPEILDLVQKYYPLPVYSKDSSGGVSLVNNHI